MIRVSVACDPGACVAYFSRLSLGLGWRWLYVALTPGWHFHGTFGLVCVYIHFRDPDPEPDEPKVLDSGSMG